MGTLQSSAAYVALLLGCFGCGANHGPNDGANAPPAPVVGSSIEAGAPEEAGPGTTTAALPDSKGAEGTKLAEAHPGPSSSGAANAPAHSHDPGRGPADIRAIVVAHRDEARACYDRGLSQNPMAEGDLVIQWTIDPKGTVTQAALDASRSTITDPAIVDCITGIIKKLQFATSAGGYETKAFYPFNFHPRHNRTAGQGTSP